MADFWVHLWMVSVFAQEGQKGVSANACWLLRTRQEAETAQWEVCGVVARAGTGVQVGMVLDTQGNERPAMGCIGKPDSPPLSQRSSARQG